MKRFPLLLFFVIAYAFVHAQRECASSTYRDRIVLLEHGQVNEAVISERPARNYGVEQPSVSAPAGGVLPVIQIPVVVHVIYRTETERISYQQVVSQIERLNKDFRKLGNLSAVPSQFVAAAADCYIEFKLATTDPLGTPTHGVVWKKTDRRSFGMDDAIKFSSSGGDDAWDASSYLNIWVGNLTAGLVGYASPAGINKQRDGIVVRYTAFGETGTATPPHHLGRTAVHEVGHWLGLKHIWGDKFCGDDDISDTPPQRSASRGCPVGNKSCGNEGDMYVNFMDLADDACSQIFTFGQREKMRAMFEPGAPRYTLLSSKGASGVMLPPPTSETPHGIAYTNPVINRLTVKATDQVGDLIRLFDITGRILAEQKVTRNVSELDVSGLPAGVYFLRIGSGKSYKIVKKNP